MPRLDRYYDRFVGVQQVAPEEIVREVREWIGTKWHNMTAHKGVHTDCLGLIKGVGLGTGAASFEPYTVAEVERKYFVYGTNGNARLMQEGLPIFMHPVENARFDVGDVLQIRYHVDGVPRHFAIYIGRDTVVHSLNVGPRMVCEHRLDDTLRDKVYKVWRYPGVQLWRDDHVSN